MKWFPNLLTYSCKVETHSKGLARDTRRGPHETAISPKAFSDPMRRALLLIDIQNDFLPPHGALAVPQGDAILPCVYRLLEEGEWAVVLASQVSSPGSWVEWNGLSSDPPRSLQDYHPPRHVSFASRWPGGKPFTSQTTQHPRTRREIRQELWPDHCVQGTPGCEFERGVQERLDERRRRDGSDSCNVIQKVRSIASFKP